MSTELIDLDLILGKPKRVKIEGETYLLPADIPSSLYLKLADIKMDRPIGEIADEIADEILAMFRVHQPDLERLPGSLNQLVLLPRMVYGGGQEDAAEADPPKAPAKGKGGTKSTSRKKKASSASSS